MIIYLILKNLLGCDLFLLAAAPFD